MKKYRATRRIAPTFIEIKIYENIYGVKVFMEVMFTYLFSLFSMKYSTVLFRLLFFVLLRIFFNDLIVLFMEKFNDIISNIKNVSQKCGDKSYTNNYW